MKGTWIRRGAVDAPVIVFVHGVLSSSETAWRHQNGNDWPTIVARDPLLADVGIWTFSYRTGLFSGRFRIGDAVNSLKEHMELDGVLSSNGVLFVCHSMGGLVVRKYLVSREAELIEDRIPVALFLVASPSLGSDYANWVALFARAVGHAQADALRSSATNVWLLDLHRDFINMKEGGRLPVVGKELSEDQFVALWGLWRKQIVEDAEFYFRDPYKVPGSDHFSIAKPEDSNAIQHQLLRQFTLNWRSGMAANRPFAGSAAKIAKQQQSGSVPASRHIQLELTQMRLNSAGYRVAIDGVLGNETVGALLAFQREMKLEATGTLNSSTEAALLSCQEDFKTVQRDLIALDYAVAADGLCGRLTTTALKNFQANNALPASGIADEATRSLLRRLVADR